MIEYWPSQINMPNTQYCPPPKVCIPQETVLTNVRLAAAYIPYQKLCTLFPPIEGFKRGTIFPELFSPYEPQDKKAKPSVCK